MFRPVTPLSGIAGWNFLQRTQDAQQVAFDKSPALARDVAYFKENIAKVKTAEDLVSDHTLFKVALGAFGLDEQLGSKFFMRKILEEGTEDRSALASRLVDKRFHDIAEAFGFGNLLGARTGYSDFAETVTRAYKDRQFEIAVGQTEPALRLAMSFKREIEIHASSGQSDDAAWFSIMGKPPLREVFETAFNLPKAFGQLDINRQREVLQEETRAALGSDRVAVFQSPDAVNKFIDRFLARAQIAAGPPPNAPGSTALSLLQPLTGFGAAGQINLILSNA